MGIVRCHKVIFFDPPKQADSQDYFLFKHHSGFWMVWKNTLSSEKYQCDSLKDAFTFAAEHAGVRGCNLWLSLDGGNEWEKHVPEDFYQPELLERCGEKDKKGFSLLKRFGF